MQERLYLHISFLSYLIHTRTHSVCGVPTWPNPCSPNYLPSALQRPKGTQLREEGKPIK